MKDTKVPIDTASVKVMRSHDYCHFEVNLSTTLNGLENGADAVDELRKTAARLADKAVEQYKVAKRRAELTTSFSYNFESLELKDIKAKSESERSPDEKAKLKAWQDAAFQANRRYDYEDNWED